MFFNKEKMEQSTMEAWVIGFMTRLYLSNSISKLKDTKISEYRSRLSTNTSIRIFDVYTEKIKPEELNKKEFETFKKLTKKS